LVRRREMLVVRRVHVDARVPQVGLLHLVQLADHASELLDDRVSVQRDPITRVTRTGSLRLSHESPRTPPRAGAFAKVGFGAGADSLNGLPLTVTVTSPFTYAG